METIRHTTRRSFIATLITLPLILAGLWRFLTPGGVKKPALLQVAQDDIPVGAALVFRQERVAIMREGNSFIALSLVCTHLGCTVSVTPEGITCPCHGSRFDRLGTVLSGPADRSLARLTVEQNGNELVVRG
ncbi:MAG: Rieske (2Fe-2S) protein [Proteobacteria bacterium]|nr:Rieske (2Fe-2S) protein [Pseudomonadota bacterium]